MLVGTLDLLREMGGGEGGERERKAEGKLNRVRHVVRERERERDERAHGILEGVSAYTYIPMDMSYTYIPIDMHYRGRAITVMGEWKNF
jgi:hypothetical protein